MIFCICLYVDRRRGTFCWNCTFDFAYLADYVVLMLINLCWWIDWYSIRRSLTQATLTGLVVSLVLTRVDYCNSVLTSLPLSQLNRLQAVIDAAARLILSGRRCDHITPLLEQLHWLRVPEKNKYKLCVLVYRCLHGMAPKYLANSFQRVSDVTTRRHLRSAATSQLIVPATRCSTLGDRAFPVAAARAWNALPHSVSSASSLPILSVDF